MKKIVCLGDSITCNWNAPSYVDEWQKLVVADKLPYEIIGAGVNGETAQDGYYRIIFDVISHQPDLVTVMFGHNDADSTRNISPVMYANYVRKIVNRLQHESSAKIWLLTPQQIGEANYESGYQPYLDQLKQAALYKKVELVDLWSVFEGEDLASIYTGEMLSTHLRPAGADWLHPNQKGHQIIAQRLQTKLVDDLAK